MVKHVHPWGGKSRQSQTTSIIKNFLQLLLTFFAIGLLLFSVLFYRFEVVWYLSLGAGILTAAAVTVFLHLNKNFGCLMAISMVKLVGPESRFVLMSLVSGIIIAGPLLSIAYNLNEVQRTTQCTSDLVKEHADQLNNAYLDAYKDVSDRIEESIAMWKDLGNEIESVIGPIRNAFSVAAAAITDVMYSIDDVRDKCDGAISKAKEDCSAATKKAYEDCLDVIPSLGDGIVHVAGQVVDGASHVGDQIADGISHVGGQIADGASHVGGQIADGASHVGGQISDAFGSFFGRRKRSETPRDLQYLCLPINLGSEVCGLLSAEVLCSPLKLADVTAFRDIARLLRKVVELFELSVEPKKTISHGASSSMGNMSEVFNEIREDFNEKFQTIRFVFKIFQICLTIPLFLVPIPSAYFYIRRYHKAVGHKDNSKIDLFFAKDKHKERKSLLVQFAFLVTHFLLSLAIMTFDYLLFWGQNVAHVHAGANFSATGSVDMRVDVHAGPVFQPLVDRFIDTLTLERKYEFSLSTYKCLPDPMDPNSLQSLTLVAVLYSFMAASFILQFFVGTYKRKIIQRFYPPGARGPSAEEMSGNSKRKSSKEKDLKTSYSAKEPSIRFINIDRMPLDTETPSHQKISSDRLRDVKTMPPSVTFGSKRPWHDFMWTFTSPWANPRVTGMTLETVLQISKGPVITDDLKPK